MNENENWNGILNVYKEAGWTSFDVVAKLRGILKTKKIGHGGTLDPSVTGVLPVAVGKATRLLEYMEAAGKIYEGQVTIGFSTETEDADGQTVATTPVLTALSTTDIDAAMAKFVGKIKQIPPMYSAVRINGKHLYEYARAGEIIDRPAREVTIKSFERTSVVDLDAAAGLLKFDFKVACSKGTYVRTLAVDLAESLGYAGHMSKLQRTAANGLLIENSMTLAEIEQARDADKLSELFYPAEYAVTDLPHYDLTFEQYEAVKVGKKFEQESLTNLSVADSDKFAAFYNEKLIAVYMKHPEKEGIWKPNKVLA
jgi:tRNA pseudouridine55 synthase